MGPPVHESITALEKVAVEMPEVCMMDPYVEPYAGTGDTGVRDAYTGTSTSHQAIKEYFKPLLNRELPDEICNRLISKTGGSLGEYDFYFEWFRKPTTAEVMELIKKIDTALTPLGVHYTITTKN